MTLSHVDFINHFRETVHKNDQQYNEIHLELYSYGIVASTTSCQTWVFTNIIYTERKMGQNLVWASPLCSNALKQMVRLLKGWCKQLESVKSDVWRKIDLKICMFFFLTLLDRSSLCSTIRVSPAYFLKRLHPDITENLEQKLFLMPVYVQHYFTYLVHKRLLLATVKLDYNAFIL